MALGEKSSVVVVATGSRYAMPNIPGSDREKVTTATGLLLGKRPAEEPIVIIGGGLTGCETALWLAQQGKDVTIVEMLDELMRGGIPVFHANRTMLLDLLKFHKVHVLTNTSLLDITDDGVGLIDGHFRRSTLRAGTVVLATGLECDQKLFRSLRGEIPHAYLIGDAKQPRNIMHAIWDAYEVAKNI
jgi:2-enoate reductase